MLIKNNYNNDRKKRERKKSYEKIPPALSVLFLLIFELFKLTLKNKSYISELRH